MVRLTREEGGFISPPHFGPRRGRDCYFHLKALPRPGTLKVMQKLSEAVLTQLVQVMVRVPNSGWNQAAFAQAHAATDTEVQQVLQALRRAGLIQAHRRPDTLDLADPAATQEGVRHLMNTAGPDAILLGHTQVRDSVLGLLARQDLLTASEMAPATGLNDAELQPHLHLLYLTGYADATVVSGGAINSVARR